MTYRSPRFMTDAEIRTHFGIDADSLRALRRDPKFPQKMRPELTKTDSRVIDHYFDVRSGVPIAGVVSVPEFI